MPIENMLSSTDVRIYRNYYCETCHQLKEHYGYISTSIVNYEMTFACILLNSVLDDGLLIDVQKKGRICIIKHPFGNTLLLKKIAAYTILVANNGLVDDKMDLPSLKSNLGLLGLNHAVNKARNDFPEYDRVIMEGYEKLRAAEENDRTDVVEMGGLSAQSMIDVLDLMIGDRLTEDLKTLFRYLGIWVYVMDAIEDLDEDHLNGTYNPYLVDCTDFTDGKTFVRDNIYAITETMNSVIGGIQTAYARIRSSIRYNGNILENIIYNGIPVSAHRIISGDKTMSLSLKNVFRERLNRGGPPAII